MDLCVPGAAGHAGLHSLYDSHGATPRHDVCRHFIHPMAACPSFIKPQTSQAALQPIPRCIPHVPSVHIYVARTLWARAGTSLARCRASCSGPARTRVAISNPLFVFLRRCMCHPLIVTNMCRPTMIIHMCRPVYHNLLAVCRP